MGTPNTVCADWRFAEATDARNWIELAHTDLSSPDSWLDTTLCLRPLLDNTGNKDESDGYKWQYDVDGAGWVDITTSSSYVKAVDHPFRTDGQATSQELGGGTFDEGVWDDNGVIASYTLAQGQESEHELSFQFIAADCAGHTVELKIVFDGGADLDGYTYNNPSSTFSLGDIYVTPGAADANASAIDPTVLKGSITLTPAFAESLASALDPAVRLGSITLTPAFAESLGATIDPSVVLGSISITPVFVEALASALDPAVTEGGDVMVTPGAADADASGVDPAVVLGSINFTPAVAEVLASAVDPAVVLGSHSMTPAQVVAVALAMDPNVVMPGAVARWVCLNLLTLGVGGRRG